MATLISVQDHNFTASSWGTADATSLLVSSAANTNLTTSYVLSSTFTPGAITIDGIAVWVNTVLGSTGTISVALDQATVTVVGTEVTINVTDLPSNGNCWVLFKFAAPVLLIAATAYSVKAKTSSATQVNLFRNATAGNWSRLLRTTTTAAPGAGDNLYILAEKTGAGTQNTSTVTMDNTASTIFGQIDIQSSGTLINGTAASTAYVLKWAGNLNIRSGGSVFIGTPGGTGIPSTSTAEYFVSNSSNVDFGIIVTGNGIFKTQGDHNANPWALLAADASASATSLTTNVSTGWKNGDTIGIASTTRTASQSESKALTADASGTTLTIAALTNAHAGGGVTNGPDVVAELINLTRNVKIHGASTSLQTYISCAAATVLDLNDAEFYNMGSATAGKRGISISTTTGSFSAQYCSLHDFTVSQSCAFVPDTAANANITIAHCVGYNNAGSSNPQGSFVESLTATATGAVTISDCVAILSVGPILYLNYNTNVSSVRVAGVTGSGGAQQGIYFSNRGGGTITDIVAHSCASDNLRLDTNTSAVTITNLTTYRSNASGILFNTSTITDLSLDNLIAFGSQSKSINVFAGQMNNLQILNSAIRAGLTLTCPIGIEWTAQSSLATIVNTVFGGSGQTHATADINSNSVLRINLLLDNVALNSATQVANSSSFTTSAPPLWGIRANFLGQTQNHKSWWGQGTWSYDTTFVDGSGASLRMTPSSASIKLQSSSFLTSVPSGQTATVSVKVRKSVIGDGAAYNGNQPRLVVRRNYGGGVTADTVLDTATAAADGAFETLSGTTVAVAANCVLEFFVDCDGTTGWTNIDTWDVVLA